MDPSSVLQSGGTATVDWSDSNVGDATASGGWYDNVTVVNATTGQTLVNANQTYSSQSISAGTSTARSYRFTLPDGAPGVGQLGITVTADAGGSLLEYNSSGTIDTNRSGNATTQSTLGSYPDLHVTALAMDPSSVLQSGGTVTVDWSDSNVGDATASGGWYDNVTVVNATTGQTLVNANQTYSSQSISAGGSTARSYGFTLPDGATGVGQLSITVTADAGLSLLEYNSSGVIDTNRSANITAQTTLGAYPDLHATGVAIDATSTLQSGGPVTVDWNDSNVGTAAASGGWYDNVTVVDTTTGQMLLNANPTFGGNNIPAGGSTARSYSFTLPNGAAGVGQLSITITADAGTYLLEYNKQGAIDTNRSATISAQSTLGAYPDLHATAVAVDPSSVLQSGGSLTVDWNDSNVGSASADGGWYDQVQVVNTATGRMLANAGVTRSSSGDRLAAGQAESHQYTCTLPYGTAGAGGTEHHRHGRRGRQPARLRSQRDDRHESFGQYHRPVVPRALSQRGRRHGLGPGHDRGGPARHRLLGRRERGNRRSQRDLDRRDLCLHFARRDRSDLRRQRDLQRHAASGTIDPAVGHPDAAA